MNAILPDEQRMLAESARKVFARGAGAPQARWSEFAELGWLALPVPEAHGGLAGGLPDLCVLAEELGRGLAVEPYVACSVLGGMLLADVAPAALRAAWLPALAEGGRRVAFAPWEPNARHDARAIATQARPAAEGWQIDGEKALALGAAGAHAWLLAARTGAARLGLFLVEAGAPGLQQHTHGLYDGRQAASLRLQGAQATLLLEAADAEVHARIATALGRAAIVHAAETVGTMARAFETTRDYVATRQQFGKPIAANQVVQHRLVDLYVEIEEARALVRAAAAAPRPAMASAAAALVAQTARHVWEESIQLHGAIGMTEECAVGACVRRLALASSAYGDAHHHLAALADQLLEDAA
ncbi:acyl-CoA dehydrogenase family protein [Pseudorhodoferax sp.]|uniref:acyl-CoA dehydrogenase family protein n=1 Tax=Pseudorhodoferax sp. TaxID=1993553 RepID=UPI002DD64B5C|nr:acyl-CoA dehydrogenase [Pseudorhodoferax sp.]